MFPFCRNRAVSKEDAIATSPQDNFDPSEQLQSDMTNIYDAVIVGGGPAGLSAALMLGRCRRRVVLCDAGQPRNRASPAVHCLLGREGTSPNELLAKGRAELERYTSVTLRAARVMEIASSQDQFTAACADGFSLRARKVLLTTGLVDDVPKLDGIERLYAKAFTIALIAMASNIGTNLSRSMDLATKARGSRL
jgi:thioredoxin reductase